MARALSVNLREQAMRLPVAPADSGKLNAAALHALAAIWKPRHQCKKAG